MSKINVLDSSIFNRIAAGEVVENPRSVVKELVENSIDAGADNITVEIRGGGIDYICVTDNGKGIEKDDMPLAFLPHATSKIHNIKDLEAITTLGFRGEALPSIASVADVEISSRTPYNELGYRLTLKNGKICDEGTCGIAFGTKVTVKNIFANIPARAKFLRKPQMEESAITEFIIKIILSNPQLKFKYITDGEVCYQSDGNGVESAIYNVYGNEFLSNLVGISYTMPDISLSGYICKPNYTKHNRTYQTLIVNGRYIVNQDISYCIQQCYQNYLMKRQFPAYVLYLNLPADMIDVNVHPNKLDVRFSNEKRLKGILYNTIKSKVDELATSPTLFSPIETDIENTKTETADTNENEFYFKQIHESDYSNNRIFKTDSVAKISEPGIIRTKLNSFIQNISYREPEKNEEQETAATAYQFTKPEAEATCLFSDDDAETRFAGKLFNTYLFLESGDNFYIIDQHAAHEKLLYDKLVNKINQGDNAVQDLLVPYIFDVSPCEKATLTDHLQEINSYGFKIDALSGYAFSLYALPLCCAEMNLKKFVTLLLSDLGIHKNKSDFVKESIMQAACKSAVKGEADLSQNEIDSLISQMKQSNTAKFCPHGRPTIIKFSKSDLEKLFKRTT